MALATFLELRRHPRHPYVIQQVLDSRDFKLHMGGKIVDKDGTERTPYEWALEQASRTSKAYPLLPPLKMTPWEFRREAENHSPLPVAEGRRWIENLNSGVPDKIAGPLWIAREWGLCPECMQKAPVTLEPTLAGWFQRAYRIEFVWDPSPIVSVEIWHLKGKRDPTWEDAL